MVLVLLVVAFFAFVSRIVLVRAFGLGVLVFGPFSCLFCTVLYKGEAKISRYLGFSKNRLR